MSPIASIPAAFALSTATPSVALDPDIAGQSASTVSQYLAGTGGFVFVAVAIVSVAGYFYHGRGTANDARKNTTWATFSSFLSAMRHRGSGTTTAATGSGWPPDVEGGFEQHVSMVYARFFHPTFWNLVECHPATASAPAIYVEDEANEIPASELRPYGMNSYLDMNDDDGEGDGDEDKKTRNKAARENADQGPGTRVVKTPPYDASSATDVRFKSAIIGATDRPGGAFLCVPGKYEDGSSDTSSSETSLSSELHMACSPYDGILDELELELARSPYDGILKAPRTPDGTFGTSLDSGAASELAYLNDSQEFTCSPQDGTLTTPRSLGGTTSDSELDFSCSPYGGMVTDSHPDIDSLPYVGTPTTPMRSPPSARRYGMADMAELARTLKHSIPEEGSGLGLVRTIGCRSGLCDLTDFDDTDSEAESATSYRHLDLIETADDKAISSDWDVDVHDNCDGVREDWSDGNMFAPPHEDPILMQRILEELRDPSMDCTPRALSEDSDFEFGEDDIIEDDEETVLELEPTWSLDRLGRISLEWTSSTDSDVYVGGSIYPLTPTRSSVVLLSPPCVYKSRMAPPAATLWFDEEVRVVVPTSSDSPVWLPSRPYVRTHRRRPSVVCGPTWLPY